MRRILSDRERALLERFLDAAGPGEQQLRAQLAVANVVGESPGYLNLSVPDSAPRVDSSAGYPLHGWYDDVDGTLVSLLLHVPDGKIDTLERYRVDGEAIVNVLPDPRGVRVDPNPLDGPGQSAEFDRATGWRRTS